MTDILHKVGVRNATPRQVYDALTTNKGLAGWWTSNTIGAGEAEGDLIEFRFGAGGFTMRVKELVPEALVVWELAEGPEEWMGTTIRFDLKQDGEYVIVLFSHLGWREPVEFLRHCSTKWAIFLVSLKALLETGKGRPDPDDVKIDNWN